VSASRGMRIDVEVRVDGPRDGLANMALDLELLDHAEAGRPGCRVYEWDGHWVSLGRFQNPHRDLLDPDATPWVLRPTGGKAVMHGRDVTVGLAVPLSLLPEEAGTGRSIKAVYRQVVRPIVDAMRDCGVRAALAEGTRFAERGARTADCFSHISPNDIVDEATGLKICGCALRLTRRSVLVQASIPFAAPLKDPGVVIRNGRALAFTAWRHAEFAGALATAMADGSLES
jgi:lipoate-protein ligase A